ncbi:MAG: uracil-DNA glycosylase family protein [Nanobdellota archaeon]
MDKLEHIKQKIEDELDCPLKDNATNMVFGKGNPEAEILFIGEAPGGKEDEKGVPFVGSAGKKLDNLLDRISLSLDDIYIANILKYRPPKNRDPKPDEIERHTPYLVEQIKAIKPRIIATLGNFSTKFVLAGFDVKGMKKIGGISGLHGKFMKKTVDGMEFTVVPLYHPAAMIYRPQLKEVLESDFRKMGEFLGKTIKDTGEKQQKLS